jgi:hypothetical protein
MGSVEEPSLRVTVGGAMPVCGGIVRARRTAGHGTERHRAQRKTRGHDGADNRASQRATLPGTGHRVQKCTRPTVLAMENMGQR